MREATEPLTRVEAGTLAEFDASGPMAAAAGALRARGVSAVTTYTPFDVAQLPERLGRSRTWIPAITLIAGIVGAAFAYWVQWFTDAQSYPLNAGGRPAHAGLAFVLITFETTVLFAAVTSVIAFFALLRLPRLWSPVDEIPDFQRATLDRFWVATPDDRKDVVETLARHHPRRIVRLETED